MKRKVMLMSVISLFASYSLIAQQIAKGYVFQDSNKNNIRDKNERGIAQVAVSNGKDVVQTNNEGYYELPVQNDNILFVIKPKGHVLPLNEYNMPAFYYIHKPLGSPKDFKYEGVSPTGNLPSEINFGLIPFEEKQNFQALIFGDPQPYSLEEIDYFDKGIIQEAKNNNNALFGISLGDLVGDKLDLHLPYSQAIKKMNLTWFNVMGNHDMNYEALHDSLSDETFEKNFGPANYSFNYGNAHFIILDNILYPDPRDGKGYWGGFREDQLAFIKNDLQFVPKDRLIVLAFHIPLLIDDWDEFMRQDRQTLFDYLEGYENVLALSAHTHLQRHNFYTQADGWRNIRPLHEFNIGTTSGDWYSGAMNEQGVPVSTMRDGTPKGYGFLNIKDNQYTLNYKVAGKPADYQMNIYAPKVVEQNKRTSAQIAVNFFIGCSTDEVKYRIDNGKWAKMKYEVNVDPSYLSKLIAYDESNTLLEGKRPSNPWKSTHIWSANISTNLPEGNHTIEVKAKDMFGNEFTQTQQYKVIKR